MKKLTKAIATTFAASSLLMASSVMAADQKIGVVNFQEVMQQIPQTAQVMQVLEAEFKDESAAIKKLQEDLKYMQEKKKRDGALMSAKEKEELDAKMAKAFQDYQKRGQEFQQKSQQRQNQETSKIIALVRQSIDKIAANKKFDLILEQKAVVFAKPDTNITEDVVKQVSKLK